jgi:hypothetical protein
MLEPQMQKLTALTEGVLQDTTIGEVKHIQARAHDAGHKKLLDFRDIPHADGLDISPLDAHLTLRVHVEYRGVSLCDGNTAVSVAFDVGRVHGFYLAS